MCACVHACVCLCACVCVCVLVCVCACALNLRKLLSTNSLYDFLYTCTLIHCIFMNNHMHSTLHVYTIYMYMYIQHVCSAQGKEYMYM